MIVPRIVAQSQVIITVSDFERQVILNKMKLPEDKVKVIYNAVSAKFNNLYSHDRLTTFRERYKLPPDFILFLGNTAPKKNTANVIKAYVEYKSMYQDGLPLVILDYDQKLVLDYLTKTGNQKLISDFIFPGYIHSEEMPLLYNIAKLFLYPSLRESFGLPILEAMACGVPVITSNTSSMPEVAGDSALFVDPFNFQDIRDKIIQFQQDESLQSRMKQGGLKRAANFTWKASAEQLLSIYNSVIF
jgi:glycosyltransferase involved in cell wall biosynthesis